MKIQSLLTRFNRTLANGIGFLIIFLIEGADKPLMEALKIMRNKGIRRLAVIKEGNDVGVLTERRALENSNETFLPNTFPAKSATVT